MRHFFRWLAIWALLFLVVSAVAVAANLDVILAYFSALAQSLLHGFLRLLVGGFLLGMLISFLRDCFFPPRW